MQEVILYIKDTDGNYQQAEMFNDENITITSKIQDVRDIGVVFTDFSQSFSIPASKTNNKIFKHWYNYNIDNGFDTRNRADAILEIDHLPFRRGKVELKSVKLKDNIATSYSIIFYGNTINLKDLIRDDKLDVLTYLDDNFTHDYDSTTVRTGLRIGLSSASVIYPLISHTKRLYYDSTNPFPYYRGNLYHDSSDPSDVQGLAWDDLKPAILCYRIIQAIEDKYSIDFAGDFFTSDAFSNLYLWLSRDKGPIGGDENQELLKTRVCGDWGYVSGYSSFDVSGEIWTADVVKFDNTFTGTIDITTSSTDPYAIRAINTTTGLTIAEETNLVGNNTLSVEFINTGTYTVKFILETTGSVNFQAQLTIEEYIFDTSTTNTAIYNINGTNDSISTTSQIIITENVPDLKIIDFLTGIFKMFNLTAYYVDDVGDADFGKIKVLPLDDFYADAVNNPSGGSYDISKHVEISNTTVEAALNYKRLEFKHQEPSTLLAINHKNKFNQTFGDEIFELSDIDSGETYEIETPFEHMKFERIFDGNKTSTSPYYTGTDDTYVTDILWGYSADGEFNAELNAKTSGKTTLTTTDKVVDSEQSFTQRVKVGDRIRNLADGTEAKITAIDSDTVLTVSKNIFTSGENYTIFGSSNDGNYEPVQPKPLLFYGIQEVISSEAKSINWLSGVDDYIDRYYRPSNTNSTGTSTIFPEYTINFDNEIDEWTLTDYNGSTNSLFTNFYSNYVVQLFDKKKRIFKISAYLPTDILINYRLNDKIIIQDKEFLINSIRTNLMTEKSELELVNETEKAYYEIQLYYDFTSDNCTSGTLVTVYSDVPAVAFGSETTGKIYSNKGLSIYAPNGKYSNGTNYDTWYADGNTPTTPSLRVQGWWESEYDELTTYPLTCGGGA